MPIAQSRSGGGQRPRSPLPNAADLEDIENQVYVGVAKVYDGSQPPQRLRPEDVVTAGKVTAVVGPDGQPYAEGKPVELSNVELSDEDTFRVYRPQSNLLRGNG
jgi:hypothetical protein